MKLILSVLNIAAVLTTNGIPLGAQVSERARALHDNALVMDAHVHIINRQFHEGGSIGDRYPDGQVDLPRMIDGGLDALFFTLSTTENYYPARFETKQALRLMDHALRDIEANSDRIELALSASDVDRITGVGKVAAILDLEGSIDLDGDLGVLRMFHRLGLRVLQLPAHNWPNEYADSCCADQKFGGLNDHGRAFIREMNRLGMVINISHSSDETIEQAIEVSEDPLVATHHGLRSFNDIPRVMPEHLLRKLSAKGGLIGIHIGQSFHSKAYFDWKTQLEGRAFWDTTSVEDEVEGLSIYDIDDMLSDSFPWVGPIPPPEVHMSIDDWLKVVERAIEIAGEDHVILGTDFAGFPTPPLGMTDISDLPLLTEGMLRRGWSEERIRKFLGGNLLRVFRQIAP
ncbi:MAG: membrane dipeptidase [Verrucomicrobia bacterium]|nr:membrane dipeptidase [Verrucomicrobiota bacterium]